MNAYKLTGRFETPARCLKPHQMRDLLALVRPRKQYEPRGRPRGSATGERVLAYLRRAGVGVARSANAIAKTCLGQGSKGAALYVVLYELSSRGLIAVLDNDEYAAVARPRVAKKADDRRADQL